MTSNAKREDLRIVKTEKALTEAMFALLGRKPFGKITVYDLCDEALISRATFYTHYNDKYDLLRRCLLMIKDDVLEGTGPGARAGSEDCGGAEGAAGGIAGNINAYIERHKKMLANLLNDDDTELNGLLSVFLEEIGNPDSKDRSAMLTFCSGGLVNVLKWQAGKNFPPEDRRLTAIICDVVKTLMESVSALA
jgi:AcrR family transcriptional regulator